MTRWNEGSAAEHRLRILDQIGQRLAGSLELEVTLHEVAQILVPRFADHCLIDLFSGDKLIRRASFHAGGWEPAPGTWARVGEPISYPPGHFMQQAMSRLETIVVPDTHADYYPAPSEESMSAADDAGITSVLASPLYARGELLGVMSLALSRISDRPDSHYDLSDGDLVGAIASRVAVAIDNAMLFEAERRTALAFQQSLLPQSVPELDGLEVAFRYVPAKPLAMQGQGIQTQVGGDWYDIIPLAAGRVGLVIGDVEGRGARAAATMGQLRAALRAYAQDEKSPADIMRKLDEWVRSTAPVGIGGDPPTVSCIYLIYDAWSRELTFANAGHAAPLLVLGGKVKPLEVRHKGVLLGVRGRGIRGLPTYREQTVTLPPGAALVLYTDGLTDRRSRADGDGHYTEAEALSMLRDALLKAPATAGDLVAAAENAVPGDIDDDMAILVFSTAPEDLAFAERSFAAEPIMVSEARRLAHATFKAWDMDPDQADLALLLVSEVVTNAVLHASVTPSSSGRRFDLEMDPPSGAKQAGGAAVSVGALTPPGGFPVLAHAVPAYRPREFTLRLRRGAESVWVEAFDPDLRLPRLRTARATDEGGRGLYLVEQLATRWGSRPTPEGKAVWFEIPLDGKDRLPGLPVAGRVRRVAGAVGEGEQYDDNNNDADPQLAGHRELHLPARLRHDPGDASADEHEQDDRIGHLSVSFTRGGRRKPATEVPSLSSRLRPAARLVAIRHATGSRGRHSSLTRWPCTPAAWTFRANRRGRWSAGAQSEHVMLV